MIKNRIQLKDLQEKIEPKIYTNINLKKNERVKHSNREADNKELVLPDIYSRRNNSQLEVAHPALERLVTDESPNLKKDRVGGVPRTRNTALGHYGKLSYQPILNTIESGQQITPKMS